MCYTTPQVIKDLLKDEGYNGQRFRELSKYCYEEEFVVGDFVWRFKLSPVFVGRKESI